MSSERSNAARRELVAGVLSENKVKQISGLASTVNLVKEDPEAAVNRRISIVALRRQAEEQMDAQQERHIPADHDAGQIMPDAVAEQETADSTASAPWSVPERVNDVE